MWAYTPPSLGRTIAEEWIAANDCSFVDSIMIAENSLTVTSRSVVRRPGITIKLNRQWDLAADLAEAVSSLRRALEPRRLRVRRNVRSC